jgi:pinin/SDK/memA/ protein conserved region
VESEARLARARHLRTKNSPTIYFRPYKLTEEQKLEIEEQVARTQAEVDAEEPVSGGLEKDDVVETAIVGEENGAGDGPTGKQLAENGSGEEILQEDITGNGPLSEDV